MTALFKRVSENATKVTQFNVHAILHLRQGQLLKDCLFVLCRLMTKNM